MNKKIEVVIPCFKVKAQIARVIEKLPLDLINNVFVIDGRCPEESGKFVENLIKEKNISNVKIIKNKTNLGVGGATKKGFIEALKNNNDIAIKLDGEDQMDSKNIQKLIKPLISENYDYTKGNRFFNLEDLKGMPTIRILGNSVLALLCKLSTGYWNIFDPTNGYIAINLKVLKLLPLEK